jgi:hypothetical protein
MNPREWLVVFSHEWRRSLAAKGLFSWIFLIGFPVLIVSLMRYIQYSNGLPMPLLVTWGSIVFVLTAGICCMLSLLLTAAPFLQAELEGRRWTYLSVRPGAKDALLFGKHLYAASRTVLTATVSLFLCLAIGGFLGEIRYILVMLTLITLGSLAYGAVYVFIGALIPRRAMVVAVIYSMIEFMVSWIPALINRLTVQYRLRSLLFKWMDWDNVSTTGIASNSGFFSEVPWWQHVVVLLGMTVGLLIIASLIFNRREYMAIRDE